jgi:small subunit ribosomal protein S4e
MARGPKKHLKRLNAPKHWMLDKMGGIWAPRPSTGPHKLRECLPLTLILRNRLKYALTRREVQMIVMNRSIAIDGKVRTDINYPTGFQDVISIEKTNEHFRLLFDAKGRFLLHRINNDEAKFKMCRVKKISKGKKSRTGTNPLINGQAGAVPFAVTHDGRTLRYPDPKISVNDSVKLDIATGKIVDFIKFDVGATVMVVAGANTGRVGVLTRIEKHPGGHSIVHIKDKTGHAFATRVANAFVIGEAGNSTINLPKNQGVRLNILEEREYRLARKGAQ